MATTEERLAALEAKMAQLTDTRPTTYYMHQYSGEEIDSAVGRALTGGALDTSVTNVSNQLETLVRPNLLDNWYFGRPVDQRGGKIIQFGVNIYADSALKTLIGPAAYACPVVELTSTYAKVKDAKNTGSYYYAAPGDVVRGYTGAWIFTVDRWSISGSSRLLTIRDGVIHLQGANINDDYIFERCPAPPGEYCYSVLFRGNTGMVALTNKVVDLNMVPAVQTNASAGLLTLHYKLDSQLPDSESYFRIHFGGECDILAAKLELGPTQTLAHQENGVWVLNEVPKVGDELRECQRYHIKYGAIKANGYISNAAKSYYMPIFLPEAMRTTPTILGTPKIRVRFNGGYSARFVGGTFTAPDSWGVTVISANAVTLAFNVNTAVDPNNIPVSIEVEGLELSADL